MPLEDLIQKILAGTATQSEAQEHHTYDIFRALGREIRTYPYPIPGKNIYRTSMQNFDITKENLCKIINATSFVVMMYDSSEYCVFISSVGRDTWLDSANKIHNLVHTKGTSLYEMFLIVRNIHYPASFNNDKEKEKHDHIVKREIKGKYKFTTVSL